MRETIPDISLNPTSPLRIVIVSVLHLSLPFVIKAPNAGRAKSRTRSPYLFPILTLINHNDRIIRATTRVFPLSIESFLLLIITGRLFSLCSEACYKVRSSTTAGEKFRCGTTVLRGIGVKRERSPWKLLRRKV